MRDRERLRDREREPRKSSSGVGERREREWWSKLHLADEIYVSGSAKLAAYLGLWFLTGQ